MDRGQWPDWAVTVVFYAVVHETQGWLLAQHVNPRDHRARKAELRARNSTLAGVYDTLYSWSRAARYDCWIPTQKHLVLAEKLLAQVRATV